MRDISLEVDQGKVVTLIGSNGAGKTPTLKAISGLKNPYAGEIHFKGERMEETPPQDIVKQGGTTILLVEQNARLALKLSHRGYVLETGSIVLESSRQELQRSEIVKRA